MLWVGVGLGYASRIINGDFVNTFVPASRRDGSVIRILPP